MSFSVEVRGETGLMANLDKLDINLRDRAIKKAVRKALEPMRDTAKANARRRTGALFTSIDIKITSKGHKGSRIIGVMGPRTGVKFPVRIVKSGEHMGKIYVAVPTRYAHLVEFGHNLVVDGKVVGRVGPKPFMRPAWSQHGGDVALRVIENVLESEIERLLTVI